MPEQEIRPNAVYTLAEACAFLRIGDATLRRLIKAGRLPSVRVGRSYRFLGQTMLDYLAVPSPASETRIVPMEKRGAR